MSFQGGPSPELREEAVAGVDIGGVYDPRRLLFDHHQLADPRATCAAAMVYQYCTQGFEDIPPPAPEITYLQFLVEVVLAGDTGRLTERGWGLSASMGLHAFLHATRPLERDRILAQLGPAARDLDPGSEATLIDQLDRVALDSGFELLDLLEARERAWAVAQRSWERHITYRSGDGLVVALEDAPQGSATLAQRAGADLVVLSAHEVLPRSCSLELWARREILGPVVNVAELLDMLERADPRGHILQAVHRLRGARVEQGFAVSGTPKAPDPRPLPCTAADLAAAVDQAWGRTSAAV